MSLVVEAFDEWVEVGFEEWEGAEESCGAEFGVGCEEVLLCGEPSGFDHAVGGGVACGGCGDCSLCVSYGEDHGVVVGCGVVDVEGDEHGGSFLWSRS